MSNRQEILDVLRTRLAAIQIANGFQTDAGEAVFTHEAPPLGPDDPAAAIAIIVGDDEIVKQTEGLFLKLPVEIQAIARVDDASELNAAYETAESVLADVKKAIELADRGLGRRLRTYLERGSTRTLIREPGSETVGVGVTYRLPYQEVWGNP